MKGFMQKFSVLALTVFALSSASAEAARISARGGLALPSGDLYESAASTNLFLSGELTFGLSDIFELGAFYDYTNVGSELEGGPSLASSFYGALVRVGLGPVSDLFVDGKIGFSDLDLAGADSALGFGAGLGYNIGLAPMVSLTPRVGYRYLPVEILGTKVDGSMIDFSVGVTAGF